MRVPVILNLVQRLLIIEAAQIREAAEDQGQDALVAAAERVLEKFREHLSRKIGTEGFRTLLARALTLSKARFPQLNTVTVSAGGTLGGLREAEAAAALVAQLLELLTTFIGEDLTWRIVTIVWPDFVRDDDFSGDNTMDAEKETDAEKEIDAKKETR